LSLGTLAFQRLEKPKPVVLQRIGSIGVADDTNQGLDIGVERRFSFVCSGVHGGALRMPTNNLR
jgi:hypothetical protein